MSPRRGDEFTFPISYYPLFRPEAELEGFEVTIHLPTIRVALLDEFYTRLREEDEESAHPAVKETARAYWQAALPDLAVQVEAAMVNAVGDILTDLALRTIVSERTRGVDAPVPPAAVTEFINATSRQREARRKQWIGVGKPGREQTVRFSDEDCRNLSRLVDVLRPICRAHAEEVREGTIASLRAAPELKDVSGADRELIEGALDRLQNERKAISHTRRQPARFARLLAGLAIMGRIINDDDLNKACRRGDRRFGQST